MSKRPKLFRRAAIVGAGMSKFGSFKDKTTRDLLSEAFVEMSKSVDKGFDPREIQAMYTANFSSDLFEGQCHVGMMLVDWLGLVPKPSTRIETACSSGGVTIRQGVLAIASGLYDMVLVAGTEKMTNLPTEKATDTLAGASDILFEAPAGFTFPGLYASMATAYMAKYGAKVDHFMKTGIKNHNNGALNPKAQFGAVKDMMKKKQDKCKAEGKPIPSWKDELEYLKDNSVNPVVAWPMKLLDCSPISDGGACLLLVAEEIAHNFTDHPVIIAGTGQGSDHALFARDDMTTIQGAKVAAKEAYDMAGITPKDVKIAEVHDCFTIAEMVAIEDLGFFPPGGAMKAIDEGMTARTGPKPINTSGGLKSKGHPVGASGVAQAVEVFLQMRGKAGPRQVPIDVDWAVSHSVGAHGTSCGVHVYQREK